MSFSFLAQDLLRRWGGGHSWGRGGFRVCGGIRGWGGVGGEGVSKRSEGVGEHVDLLVARLRFTEGLPGASSRRLESFLAFL